MKSSLIEYLESKNYDASEIAYFQRKVWMMENQESIIDRFNSLYKILKYTDLTDEEKRLLIINNSSLLQKSDLELIAIVYTWVQTGIFKEAAIRKSGIKYNMYVRVYLRNLYLHSKHNFKNSPISYNALIMGDEEFTMDYCHVENGKGFYPSYENLICVYGKGYLFDDKKQYIEDYITRISLKWFKECLSKNKENNNANRSI